VEESEGPGGGGRVRSISSSVVVVRLRDLGSALRGSGSSLYLRYINRTDKDTDTFDCHRQCCGSGYESGSVGMLLGLLDPDPLVREVWIRIILSSSKNSKKTLNPTVL
jgi:hypothetical protein